MKNVVDLTHPIHAGMPVYPGDPSVRLVQAHTITESGYSVAELTLGTHTGTHVDVPRHVLFSDHGVSDIPLDSLVGWADVIDLSGKPLDLEITAADLDQFSGKISEESRLIIRTDWSKRFGTPDFFEGYPSISEGAAAWLIGHKIKLICIEQPSVDTQNQVTIHKTLLSAGMVIVESVTNLDSLTQDTVYLVALPLNLQGLDGSPTRVIAIEGLDE